MEIGSKMLEMGEKCSWINCYQVGMRDWRSHMQRTPKMVSPGATHKQLLIFLMFIITGVGR